MKDDRKTSITTNNMGFEAEAAELNKTVVARVSHGCNVNLDIQILSEHDIGLPAAALCQPRQGAERHQSEGVALPEELVKKLVKNDQRIAGWLARDSLNAEQFLSRPVEALVRSGVKLTKEERKILGRAHRAVAEAGMLAPGVKISKMSVSAGGKPPFRGTVEPENKDEEKDRGSQDCGCGTSRRGW